MTATTELIVIASTSGNIGSGGSPNDNTEVEGDSSNVKTSWIITRINY